MIAHKKAKNWSGKLRWLIVICLWLFSISSAMAQDEFIYNPSLEYSMPGDYFPYGWFGIDSQFVWNDPSLKYNYFSDDPDAGQLGPVDGEYFILLRSRGIYYPDRGGKAPGQREYIIQELISPLEKENCYTFGAHMFTSTQDDNFNPNFSGSLPLKMQLWGGNENDYFQVVLCESEAVTDSTWREQFFPFIASEDFTHIALTVMWDFENVYPEQYDGIILFDALSLEETFNDTIIEHIEFYQGDGQHTLNASPGLSYNWSRNAPLLSNDTIANPIVMQYAKTFDVWVSDGETCPHLEKFELIRPCTNEYGDSGIIETDVYLQRDITRLIASVYPDKYYKWEWSDTSYLSFVNPREVHIKALNDKQFYTLEYSDSNNCYVKEKFNIIIDCDILYPGGELYVWDTVSDGASELMLEPAYGTVNRPWQPPYQLSCDDCYNPIATPSVSVRYSAEMIDTLQCLHTEYFNIEIPLEVPNVITPNGDGHNDCFIIPGLPQNTALYIFDKTGRERYGTEHYDVIGGDCWAGTDNNGNALDAGNYWFVLEHPTRGVVKKDFIYIKR